MNAREDELDETRILERLRLRNLAGKKNLIEGLRKRRSQRATALLVEVLQDESWFLREQAVLALAEAGAEAVGPVLGLLKDGLWYSRAAAAKVLGKMGELSAVDPLIDCLLDSNKTVQGAAAAALVEIVGKTSVDQLVSPLSSRPADVKDKVISCLRLLDQGLASEVAGALDRRVAPGGALRDVEGEELQRGKGGAQEDDERE